MATLFCCSGDDRTEGTAGDFRKLGELGIFDEVDCLFVDLRHVINYFPSAAFSLLTFSRRAKTVRSLFYTGMEPPLRIMPGSTYALFRSVHYEAW